MGYPVNKYKAKKCFASTGEQMDSKKERDRYEELLDLERHHKISSLERQVEYELIPKQELLRPYKVNGRMKNFELACSYIADFVYIDSDGNQIVEDVKSKITRKNAEYIIKRKLMLYLKGIQIKEV